MRPVFALALRLICLNCLMVAGYAIGLETCLIERFAPPWHHTTHQIESAHLIFRTLTMADAPQLQALLLDPESAEPFNPPESFTQDLKHVGYRIINAESKRFKKLGVTYFISTKEHPDEMVGIANLSRESLRGEPTDGFSYGIHLNRRFWGRQFGTEISARMCSFAFEAMNASHIVIETARVNRGMKRILQNLGINRDSGYESLAGYLIDSYVLRKRRWQNISPNWEALTLPQD